MWDVRWHLLTFWNPHSFLGSFFIFVCSYHIDESPCAHCKDILDWCDLGDSESDKIGDEQQHIRLVVFFSRWNYVLRKLLPFFLHAVHYSSTLFILCFVHLRSRSRTISHFCFLEIISKFPQHCISLSRLSRVFTIPIEKSSVNFYQDCQSLSLTSSYE